MTNNTIADIICRLKTASKAKLRTIKVLKTKFSLELLCILKRENIIKGFIILKNNEILILLRYYKNKRVPLGIELISKPGNRKYWTLNTLSKKISNNTAIIYIISTSKGLKTSNECILGERISGEILLKINI